MKSNFLSVPVTADASNFELINTDTAEQVTGINVALTSGDTVATLTFTTGESIVGSLAAGVMSTLGNGNYQLRYKLGGFGGASDQVDTFFRKYGETNASDSSVRVSLVDFAAFRSAFGSDVDDGDFDSSLDANRDGAVSLTDFAAFRSAFGN